MTNPKLNAHIPWTKVQDELILNKWGMGMIELRKLMPNKSESEIFGRRIQLLKRTGVNKA